MSNAHAVHTAGSLDTDIVIDLGCAGHPKAGGMEDSVLTLIKRFKPTILFGFDPHPGIREGVGHVYGTTVITSRRAAWTHNGSVGLELQANCTHVVDEGDQHAKAFDFSAWVRQLPDVKIVLKVDIEGAEYVILPHLIEQGLMDRFAQVLVEWHTGIYANGYESDKASILAGISCPVEEWQ